MAATTTAKRAAPKRKTTARKPAKARAAANGQANGQAHGPAVELRPPEEFVPREPTSVTDPDVPPTPSHPFGDRMIQVFTPLEEGHEPFCVPHISTVDITEEFLWSNHKKNLDLMHQSWAWMDLAEIPDDIQRQVVSLNPIDKRRFWSEWFAGFVPPPAGEPPGES